jgi:hypothetical protein
VDSLGVHSCGTTKESTHKGHKCLCLDKKGNYIDKTANNKDRDGDVERDTDEA